MTTTTTVEDSTLAVSTPVRRSSRKAARSTGTVRSSTGKRKLQSIDESITTITSTSTPSLQPPNLVEPAERSSPNNDLSLLFLDPDKINAENIHETALQLFPQDAKYISRYPVVSARIFAAFALLVADEEHHLLEPIRQLLQALVHVEAIALTEQDNDSTVAAARSKRTHFSGFDGSAVRPPVDREMHSTIGSSSNSSSSCRYHQTDNLQSLMDVKVELQKLSHVALKSVERMEQFLRTYFARETPILNKENKANHAIMKQRTILKLKQTFPAARRRKLMKSSSIVPLMNDTSKMANLCAIAIQQYVTDCQEYPAQRVVAAANAFVSEFQVLAERLKQLPPEVMTPLQHQQILMANWSKSFVSSHLQIEHRLAEQIGQSIRFLLRLYFNRAPPRLSTVNDDYDLIAENAYSKVSDCVQLVTNDGQHSEAVDDSCLSAIISRALSYVYEFCHGELHHYTRNIATISPTLSRFCVAHSSLPPTKKHRKMSSSLPNADVDWDLLRQDIQEAAQLLAVVNAAQFLYDLFTAKGVRDEIERFGGWSELEDYATFLWQYELWKICPYDAHLVILNNCDVLLQDLKVLLETMKPHVKSCETALKNVQSQYHLYNNNHQKIDTSKKASKRSKSSTAKPSRELIDLSNYFHECWMDTQLFPRVLPAASNSA
jgi:predicted  nucleic acid-binding Zn-ribbon protein